MTNSKIEAAYQHSNPEAFKKAAAYIVKHYVSSPKNGPELNESARAVIAAVTAEDMATGARLVRGKYILTGVVIGVVATTVIITIATHTLKERK